MVKGIWSDQRRLATVKAEPEPDCRISVAVLGYPEQHGIEYLIAHESRSIKIRLIDMLIHIAVLTRQIATLSDLQDKAVDAVCHNLSASASGRKSALPTGVSAVVRRSGASSRATTFTRFVISLLACKV